MKTDKFNVGDVVFVGGQHRIAGKRRKATIERVRRDSSHSFEVRWADTGKMQVVWDNPDVAKLVGAVEAPKHRILSREEN